MSKATNLLQTLLEKRGLVGDEEIESFINPSTDLFRDPFDFEDMSKAVEKIISAKNNNESIVVYGDHDVDGISGTAFLVRVFRNLGIKTDYYIANRSDAGYGVEKINIDLFYKNSNKLIITVDTGYNSLEDVKYLRSLDMDIIVTDHHKLNEELGDEDILTLNPKLSKTYKFKFLSGAGVAFKLAQGLYKTLNLDIKQLNSYLDLITIGTIADVVPMCDENRIIIKQGLKQIKHTKIKGLEYLIKYLKLNNKKISTTDISYYVSPLINSMGRIGNARRGVAFLIEEDDFEIYNIIEDMKQLNRQRRIIEKNIYDDAVKKINKLALYKEKLIFLSSNKWHPGVIGIVSSKLSIKYNKPVVLIAIDGKIGKASCRSVKGISIFNLIKNKKDLLVRYGGHDLATGFVVERRNIEELRKALIKSLETLDIFDINNSKNIKNSDTNDTDFKTLTKLKVDLDMAVDKIDDEVLETIDIISPYGTENPHPLFRDRDVKIEAVKRFGIDQRHFTATIKKNNKNYSAIGFELANKLGNKYFKNKFEIIYYPELKTEPKLESKSDSKEKAYQLIIKDIIVK